MAADLRPPLTPDETLATLAQVAAEKGDTFRVRVQRKRSLTSMPESVAVLEEARVEHFSMPETWLPRLAGGGPIFILTAYHAEDKNRPVGGVLTVNVTGEPRNYPDIEVVNRSDWTGPRVLVFPTKPASAMHDTTYTSIPSPVGNDAVPRPELSGAGGRGNLPPTPMFDQNRAAFEELKRAELAIVEKTKQLEVEAARREADARIREANARLERLERELAESRRAPVVPPPPPPPAGPTAGEVVASLVKEATPIIAELLRQGNESRIALAKMQMDSAQALARVQQEASAKTAESQGVLLNALLTRPVIDPTILAILKKDDGDSAAMTHMVEAMGTMSQTTMNLIAAASEMGLGGGGRDEEPVALKAMREGIKAIMALNGGFAQAAMPRARRSRQLPSQAQPAPRAARPAPVTTEGQVAPEPSPAGEQVLRAAEPTEGLDLVLSTIKNLQISPNDAAKIILRQLPHPTVQQAFADCGGNFKAFFDQNLGDWMSESPENEKHAHEVIFSVIDKGCDLGLFPEAVREMAKEMLEGGDEEEEVVEEEEEYDEDLEEEEPLA